MLGLKSYGSRIALQLGLTPAALYERQRALVRLGLLKSSQKRGPGGGVQLNADTLAVLLLAITATDSLSETDERIRTLCNARIPYDKTCLLTGEKTLRAAITRIISSPDLAKQVSELIVTRNASSGILRYGKNDNSLPTAQPSLEASNFFSHDVKLPGSRWLTNTATLAGDCFKFISEDLERINNGIEHEIEITVSSITYLREKDFTDPI
ncbi:hypothetical protein [Rhodoplanes sp. SY1]|uniref:hypothetical protein n=1 Tax=Rhodoplanes sp. SY1 TaxID=3166646 RepID=UPI0038B4DEBF